MDGWRPSYIVPALRAGVNDYSASDTVYFFLGVTSVAGLTGGELSNTLV